MQRPHMTFTWMVRTLTTTLQLLHPGVQAQAQESHWPQLVPYACTTTAMMTTVSAMTGTFHHLPLTSTTTTCMHNNENGNATAMSAVTSTTSPLHYLPLMSTTTTHTNIVSGNKCHDCGHHSTLHSSTTAVCTNHHCSTHDSGGVL